MPTLNQKGVIIQGLVLVLLVAGLVAGLYLVRHTQIFRPKAAPVLPSSPETSFILDLQKASSPPYTDETITTVTPNSSFRVDVYARSDTEAANLFAVKLTFPKDLLSVSSIDKRDGQSLVKNWVETVYDNNQGTISIVGGVPAPGIKTDTTSSYLMASIIFTAKAEGNASLSFQDTSAIFSNSANINILTKKEALRFSIQSTPSASPSPQPSLSASPSTTPAAASPSPKPTFHTCTSLTLAGGIFSQDLNNNDFYTVEGGTTTKLTATYNPSAPAQVDWLASEGGGTITQIPETPPNPTTVTATWVAPLNNTEQTQEYRLSALTPTGGAKEACPLLVVKVKPQQTSSPLPTSTPSVTPAALRRDGDIDSDGKWDYSDLSALLSQIGETNVQTEADLNGDGTVNTFDVVKERDILINKGVLNAATSPGDNFKYVFVTSKTYNGDLLTAANSLPGPQIAPLDKDTGLKAGDKICKTLADSSSLEKMHGRSWRAWLGYWSGNDVNHINNNDIHVPQASDWWQGQYRWPDATTIVSDNWDGLTRFGLPIRQIILMTEQGEQLSNLGHVWTDVESALDNTLTVETNTSCASWQSGQRNDNGGYSIGASYNWSHYGNESCDQQNRLYCFEQ